LCSAITGKKFGTFLLPNPKIEKGVKGVIYLRTKPTSLTMLEGLKKIFQVHKNLIDSAGGKRS
jgi:hypothetical protein